MDTYEVAAQEYWPAITGFVQSCGILDGAPPASCSASSSTGQMHLSKRLMLCSSSLAQLIQRQRALIHEPCLFAAGCLWEHRVCTGRDGQASGCT